MSLISGYFSTLLTLDGTEKPRVCGPNCTQSYRSERDIPRANGRPANGVDNLDMSCPVLDKA